jgi:hypothetical protein
VANLQRGGSRQAGRGNLRSLVEFKRMHVCIGPQVVETAGDAIFGGAVLAAADVAAAAVNVGTSRESR